MVVLVSEKEQQDQLSTRSDECTASADNIYRNHLSDFPPLIRFSIKTSEEASVKRKTDLPQFELKRPQLRYFLRRAAALC